MKRQLFLLWNAMVPLPESASHGESFVWNAAHGIALSVGFVAVVIKGEHDFNYWLYFSQPPRKIRELVLTSCDLTKLLQSQKPVSERHTPALIETLTPCLLHRTHLWAVYLYNTQHKALVGNLKLFLGNSKHPSSISHLSFPLQLFKVRMTFYVLLPVNGLPLASNR